MELLFLVLILALFMLPTFLMMRSQRKRQAQVADMQSAIVPGDAIITVSGIHGTVASAAEQTLDVEVAPGTVVTMDRAGVMRRVEPAELRADGIEPPQA